MISIPLRNALSIWLVVVALCSPTQAATELRHALVIGNSSYAASPLANPVNDAEDLGATLKQLGFEVLLKKDVNRQEMEEAIFEFGERLKRGGVGLFYYAGHGIQISGRNYLIPIGANLKKETDAKYQAVDTELIIDEMANAGNNINIVILDACRDNPFGRSFRSAARGLTITAAAPRGTIITYSTSPGKVAADGSGRNSPYTAALIENIRTPDLTIEEVFKKVRQDLGRKTAGRQIPWELSSLDGDFFFNPAKGSTVATASATVAGHSSDYASEQRQLEEERLKLQREKELIEQRRALVEEEKRLVQERQRVEEEKRKLAAASLAGTRVIPLFNAKVSEVKFFESSYDLLPKEQRLYKRKFSRTASRFIAWELNLEHAMPGRRVEYDIDAIWYGTTGSEIFRQKYQAHVSSDWTSSWNAMSYGWRESGNNTWQSGTYRVDLYVDGDLIASAGFEMY